MFLMLRASRVMAYNRTEIILKACLRVMVRKPAVQAGIMSSKIQDRIPLFTGFLQFFLVLLIMLPPFPFKLCFPLIPFKLLSEPFRTQSGILVSGRSLSMLVFSFRIFIFPCSLNPRQIHFHPSIPSYYLHRTALPVPRCR